MDYSAAVCVYHEFCICSQPEEWSDGGGDGDVVGDFSCLALLFCTIKYSSTLQECTVPAYGDVCPSTLSCHYYSLGGITCGYAVSDTASIG